MNKPFWDKAGFRNHCWECVNSTDWHGETGRCKQRGTAISKYDSPNNGCSNAAGCWHYERKGARSC